MNYKKLNITTFIYTGNLKLQLKSIILFSYCSLYIEICLYILIGYLSIWLTELHTCKKKCLVNLYILHHFGMLEFQHNYLSFFHTWLLYTLSRTHIQSCFHHRYMSHHVDKGCLSIHWNQSLYRENKEQGNCQNIIEQIICYGQVLANVTYTWSIHR